MAGGRVFVIVPQGTLQEDIRAANFICVYKTNISIFSGLPGSKNVFCNFFFFFFSGDSWDINHMKLF